MSMFDTLKQRLFRAKTRTNTFFIGEETLGGIDLHEILTGVCDPEFETVQDVMNYINSGITEEGNVDKVIQIDLRKVGDIRANVLKHMGDLDENAENVRAAAIAAAQAKKEELEKQKQAALDVNQDVDIDALAEQFLHEKQMKTAEAEAEEDAIASRLPESWKELLQELSNNVKRIERELGMNTLFLGLPIVQGKIPGGEDVFRTPLFFVGVTIIPKNIFTINLVIDTSKIILNPVIAAVAAAKSGEQFDVNSLDSYKALDTNRALHDLTMIGLDIEEDSMDIPIEEFDFSTKDDIKEQVYALDANIILPNVMLGIFDLHGNNVFWDFNQMISQNPQAIEDLLESQRDLTFDYYAYDNEFRTSDIQLFSALDIQQQLAVAHSLDGDVVIEGPPGTGKSEVILNILVNIVLRGRRALFVAEKKAALDVIYNRLGDFNHIALYISDLKKNRKAFFAQFGELEKFFTIVSEKLKYKNKEFNLPDVDVNANERLLESLYDRYQNVREQFNEKVEFNGVEYTLEEILDMNDPGLDVSTIDVDSPGDFFFWALQNNSAETPETAVGKYEILCQKILGIEYSYDILEQLFRVIQHNPKDNERFVGVIEEFKKLGRINPKAKAIKAKKGDRLQAEFAMKVKFYASKFDFIDNAGQVDQGIDPEVEMTLMASPLLCFCSWYSQSYAQNLCKELDKIQAGIERDIDIYIDKTKKSVELTKHALRKKIVENFVGVYNTSPGDLKDIMRQASVEKQKEIMWWVNRNFQILYDLYPIHMMSVDNVSTAIKLEFQMYDYILCDEASQVFLEKAIPSMYRGKSYVISGDVKQLQPSNFFQATIKTFEDDSEEESDSFVDLEEAVNTSSLMHYFKNRAQSNITLRYHYRAFFNELIEFSNSKFYDGKLLMTTKSVPKTQAIVVHDIEEGLWERSRNINEAKAVVKRVLEMTRTPEYKKSVGVITFNAKQQATIETLLDKSNNMRIAEWRERYDSDGEFIGLFVKNVENVQGDERDIILFSIAYDRTVTNYGPLTMSGGDNRLNVAITRAKERIEVFKSEPAKILYGFESTMPGPKLFVQWLLYCENIWKIKKLDTDREHELDFETEFDRQVYNFLRGEVPTSYNIGYKIQEGSYLLDFVLYDGTIPKAAIECNGKEIGSISDFRENDIYRKWFLHTRGWGFYRIWQTSWLYKPKDQKVFLARFIHEMVYGKEEAKGKKKKTVKINTNFNFDIEGDLEFETIDRRVNKKGEVKKSKRDILFEKEAIAAEKAKLIAEEKAIKEAKKRIALQKKGK